MPVLAGGEVYARARRGRGAPVDSVSTLQRPRPLHDRTERLPTRDPGLRHRDHATGLHGRPWPFGGLAAGPGVQTIFDDDAASLTPDHLALESAAELPELPRRLHQTDAG